MRGSKDAIYSLNRSDVSPSGSTVANTNLCDRHRTQVPQGPASSARTRARYFRHRRRSHAFLNALLARERHKARPSQRLVAIEAGEHWAVAFSAMCVLASALPGRVAALAAPT